MRPRRGYTLIELLVVIGILGTILSLGVIGFRSLARTGELEATTQAVRSLLRRARNSAREERFPAVVELDLEASELRAVSRETLAFYRFEDAVSLSPPPPIEQGSSFGAGQPASSGVLRGALNIEAEVFGGQPVQGRLGAGMLFGEKPGGGASRAELLMVEPQWVEVEDRPSLSPAEGLFLEVWLQVGRLEDKLNDKRGDRYGARLPDDPFPPILEAPERSVFVASPSNLPKFTVLRKGAAYELMINADYSVEVGLSGFDVSGEPCVFLARSAPGLVKAQRWTKVSLAYNGQELRLFVNDLDRVLTPISLTNEELVPFPVRLKTTEAPLRFSDPNPRRTFYGAIDELRIAGLIRGDALPIPPNILLLSEARFIRFDALGQLDQTAHSAAVSLVLSDAPELYDKLYPMAGSEKKPLTSVERKPNERGKADPEAAFIAFNKKARRALRGVAKLNRREVIVDMHGTLR